jgi:aspartate racemase
MKKVGIIGGAGPLASALFYETVIRESYQARQEIPEILLLNYPFTRGLSLNEGEKNSEILLGELSYCINTLAQQEVEIGVLACNTLHLYLKRLSHLSVSFLSLPHLVMQEAIRNGHHRLLILGTENTCRADLYCHPDIYFCHPSQADQHQIDTIIDHVLTGEVAREDSDKITRLIEKISEQMEFDGVILGCTDLPVLHHHFPIRSKKQLYDSIKIPAKVLRGLL